MYVILYFQRAQVTAPLWLVNHPSGVVLPKSIPQLGLVWFPNLSAGRSPILKIPELPPRLDTISKQLLFFQSQMSLTPCHAVGGGECNPSQRCRPFLATPTYVCLVNGLRMLPLSQWNHPYNLHNQFWAIGTCKGRELEATHQQMILITWLSILQSKITFIMQPRVPI